MLTSRAVTALTVPHGVDRYLGLINPLWSVNEVRAVVTDVAHHTPSTVTLTLRPNGNWRGAQAGQHVRLRVDVDGVLRTRCFSVACSAHRADGLIEITAKVNPAGTVSGHLKRTARPGLVVGLSQAEGNFVLPAAVPEHVLLISGGSGVTPVMSILRTLVDRRHTGRITFLHYTAGPGDVVYRDELAATHPGVTVVYPRQHGRFSREQLLRFVPDYAEALSYCCGPPSLMDAVTSLWRAEGIGDRLRVERFTTQGLVPQAGDAVGEVRFTRSGVSARGDGRTLLDQAEAAGLRPDFGCRMGVCHTCTSVKSSGSVRNVLTGTITAEPGEQIQLCVTAPCGDVELDI
ncbi:hypothetical protein ALI144C_36120 [Actinosynnema sp. ALI-1.44]|nr:hypothetical protein ALI144C_36120 [Actinosynnema sp. ALI-1.44]